MAVTSPWRYSSNFVFRPLRPSNISTNVPLCWINSWCVISNDFCPPKSTKSDGAMFIIYVSFFPSLANLYWMELAVCIFGFKKLVNISREGFDDLLWCPSYGVCLDVAIVVRCCWFFIRLLILFWVIFDSGTSWDSCACSSSVCLFEDSVSSLYCSFISGFPSISFVKTSPLPDNV